MIEEESGRSRLSAVTPSSMLKHGGKLPNVAVIHVIDSPHCIIEMLLHLRIEVKEDVELVGFHIHQLPQGGLQNESIQMFASVSSFCIFTFV